MSTHPEDVSLRAVLRTREVRERDAQVELTQARLANERAADALEDLCRALEVPVPVEGPASGFAVGRSALVDLHEPMAQARADVRAAEARRADALARWHAARSRVSAVELLLERRAVARAAEARRAEARELDDVAGRLREAARRAGQRVERAPGRRQEQVTGEAS